MRPRLALATAPAATDEELCRDFLAGNEAAFTLLVERHRTLIFSLMRRFASRPEDAADLAQQAFLRALEASGRVFSGWKPSSPTPFRSWLVRIALNLGKNHARQGARWRPTVLTEAEAAVDPSESAQESLERRERERRTQAAVLALPPRQREVLTLRVDGGMPFKDIADTLGITENNAKVQFHHAVKRLKAELSGTVEEERE